MNSTVSIYIITCDGGDLGNCYYVGVWGGDNVSIRFKQHVRGVGSIFTNKYKPLSYEVHSRVPNADGFRVEQDVTVDMMRKHGFRRVRGGSMMNMRPDCYTLSSLRWWLDYRLRSELETGGLGLPDVLFA